jgi:hypothetical protein
MHEFKIILVLEKGQTWPNYTWHPTAIKLDCVDVNDYKKTVTYLINCSDHSIQLDYSHKGSDETVVDYEGKILHDQTLEISAVYVDDILLDQQFLFDNSKYSPNYNLEFVNHCTDNNIPLVTDAYSAIKFWHNGIWRFEFEDDFWAWHCSKRKNVPSLSKDQISKYLGQSNEEIKRQLNELKKYLV